MKDWVDNGWNPEESHKTIFEHIHLADYLSSASDRGAIGSLSTSVDYNQDGLEISHLLSGKKLSLKLNSFHQEINSDRRNFLQNKEQELLKAIPEELREINLETADTYQLKRLFWWLWRCLPQKTCELFNDQLLLLMPAETRLPDSSIWSHASLTAAFAGALAGLDLTSEDLIQNWSKNKTLSHPYLTSFTFSPVQELIKASRKMRDFWSGSWLLHYLSAKVCWQLALKYGPDCFIYPNLYAQPLIDHWLRDEKELNFSNYVSKPSDHALLTAGFPNVIVLILPQAKVEGAMQYAKSQLLEEWRKIADLVLKDLQNQRHWMRQLRNDDHTWQGWLEAQWQTYWTAVPIGAVQHPLKSGSVSQKQPEVMEWVTQENKAYGLQNEKKALFLEKEAEFLFKAAEQRWQNQKRHFSVNVGSWWSAIFDQTRLSLTSIKNARTWQIPTAFGPRSTISGLGPVVYPDRAKKEGDWISEGDTHKLWQKQAGLFDGIEELNATETVKRGLEKVLPQLLTLENSDQTQEEIASSYPDLTSGVAGYLNCHSDDIQYFQQICQAIIKKFPWAEDVIKLMKNKWGIPLFDKKPQKYHPRLLNAGWLVEDAETPELNKLEKELKELIKGEFFDEIKQKQKEINNIKINYRQDIQKLINCQYPRNNPADWYVLAAGDGDSMSEWLKGNKMESYKEYIPKNLKANKDINAEFEEFIKLPKRMGPSTHSALSRALLDFSNQLVPYLTEQRYAGRLIYSGGDDVLAYTNLWEWDSWVWDIRQCFRGDKDPQKEFNNECDYWKWENGEAPEGIAKRPLFTMGQSATISFGLVIAHHSVPLAISLENLWEAEEEAKEHEHFTGNYHSEKKYPCYDKKDAVQVRVIYGNGNILKATSKFDIFNQWRKLIIDFPELDASLFEQAAQLLNNHPIPNESAITFWVKAFSDRREQLSKLDSDQKENFTDIFAQFIHNFWKTNRIDDLDKEKEREADKKRDQQLRTWLKLAAFIKRNRKILD